MGMSTFLAPSLIERSRTPELMDQPGLPRTQLLSALTGLARVHLVSGTPAQIWKEIRNWAARTDTQTLRVLDIACGGGAVLRNLAKRAEREGFQFSGLGLDINPRAVNFANQHAKYAGLLRYKVGDALSDIPGGFNVVICTLFLHHLHEGEAQNVMHRMMNATQGLLVVHDLSRSTLGYLLASVGTRLLSRAHIVHTDGVSSVRGAFTKSEFAKLAAAADLQNFSLRSVWPCRICLCWEKRSVDAVVLSGAA